MISLSATGRFSLVIGSGGMVIFATIFFILNFISTFTQFTTIELNALNITLTESTLGPSGWLLSCLITGISGLIGIKGYFDLAEYHQKNDVLFTWGVFGIVLGLVGGTVGGGLVIFSGIFLLVSYFL
jgi:hypothetical protein